MHLPGDNELSKFGKTNAKSKKSELTFLELFQHDVQFGVFKHVVDGVIIELADCCQWDVVIRINESQILDVQQGHDVSPLFLINWDSGITSFHNFIHGIEIQIAVILYHVDVIQFSHDVSHCLFWEFQGACYYIDLIFDKINVFMREFE